MLNVKMTPFIKNIVKVFSGDLIVKIIGFISLAAIARLYTPEDFGVLELAISIQLIIVTFASLKYEQAIPLPKTDNEAFNLFSLSFLLLMLFCFTCSIIAFLVKNYIAHEFEVLKKLGNLIYFIPPLIFLRGFREIISYWFIRKKRFGRNALAEIGNKFAEVTSKIVLFWLGVYGLFIGNLLGMLISVVVLLVFVFKMDRKLVRGVNFDEMSVLRQQYKQFSMFLIPSNLFWMIAERLPAILLVPMFGFTIVGFYGISFKMINEPLNILGKSIAQVLYQESSNRYSNQKDINQLFIIVFEKLFITLFLPICFLMISSDLLFKVFLGEQWIEAGHYTQILAPMMFFRFLAIPIPIMLKVREKTHVEMVFNFFLLLTCCVSLLSGFLIENIHHTLIIYSLSLSFFYVVLFVVIFIKFKISFVAISRKIFPELLVSIPCILLFLIMKSLLYNFEFVYLFLCGIVVSVYYLLVLYIYKKRGDFNH